MTRVIIIKSDLPKIDFEIRHRDKVIKKELVEDIEVISFGE